MNAETQTESKSNDINVNVNINNNKDDKKTSLIKREEEKLIDCPDSNKKGKRNKRFELYWDYTTNLTGKQQYTFTGKEMGDKFWEPDEKSKFKIGDLIIFKNSGHPNNNLKARIYAKTGLISKLEALKRGIIEKLPKMEDIYDIKFIAPNVINGKMIEEEKGVEKTNMEKIPGYRFYFCSEVDLKKNKDGKKKIVYNKRLIKEKVTSEMKKGFIKKLTWNVEQVKAKYTDIKKDPLTGSEIKPNKLIERPNSLQFAISNVELVEISDPVRLNKNKPNEVHKIRALVHLTLNKLEKGEMKQDNYEAITSILDCKGHKRRVGELIEYFREESAKNSAAFGEYLNDRLTIKYAKNQYGEMQWYQDKAKEEIAEEYLQKRLKKRKEKEDKINKKEEEEKPKKRENKLKKAKEVIKKAEEQAKNERRNMEERFDRDTDAEEKKGGSRKRKKQKRNKTRKKR